MSKVHCSTMLTSNVTNNLFLRLHCSNPFSGLWNGNIITFLWCSAFDKTVACRAECLTEWDASAKPPFFAALFLSLPHLSPPLLPSSPGSSPPSSTLSCFLLLSFPHSLSLPSSPEAHSASLSSMQVLQWIREVLSTLLMAPPFRRLMRGVCSPL